MALPLAAINAEAAADKGIRAHPQSLHRWWARRPLAIARAMIWASLVDDPSGDSSLSLSEQEQERQRLFRVLERLIRWENSNDAATLAEAWSEVERCYPGGPPPILDPFGGGGAIPLEAHRLGLRSLSGDLNPVAVLIQRSMIEIPVVFRGRPPVTSSDPGTSLRTWERALGLAHDVSAYGEWMRQEALRRVGHIYPDFRGPTGDRLTPIAWIWARTVPSPDPSWSGQVPLVTSWSLSKKEGQEFWIEPTVNEERQEITYSIRQGAGQVPPGTAAGGKGRCIATGAAITREHIRRALSSGEAGEDLIAIVAHGSAGRAYCIPTVEQVAAANVTAPDWQPDVSLPEKGLGFRVQSYGLTKWSKLFTRRQLLGLVTLSDLLNDVRDTALKDALAAGMPDDGIRLRDGGAGAVAYADAITTYLAFGVDKCLDFNSTLSGWDSTNAKIRNVFARQTIAMTWDFAECNLLGERVGSFASQISSLASALAELPAGRVAGQVKQRDARARVAECGGAVISTDPPYYDNVGYADLSDFFFVWLRRALSEVWPDECATLKTPKSDELIADPGRHGGAKGAEEHFESGMSEFMGQVAAAHGGNAPATIYYAYKATEVRDGGVRSTGWDTFLQAVLNSGMQVTATWPVRTEKPGRMREVGSNALASSIVIACRPRDEAAPLASRGEFVAALRGELPAAVRVLQSGNIAPVDLAQSTIGPGIKVFSRYAKVVEADGSSMRVSEALAIINDALGEILDGAEAELDRDSRFAVTWYAQHGYNSGRAGDADAQARAKNTSLAGIQESGIGEAHDGRFRLLERSELDADWDPVSDDRRTVWEATQYLVAALDRSESEAAGLLHRMGGYADRARQLAYLLFQKATEKGWAEEAGAYNSLITTWPVLQGGIISISDDSQQSLL